MDDREQLHITRLLLDCSVGNHAAVERVTTLVSGERNRLAYHYMNRESAGDRLRMSARMEHGQSMWLYREMAGDTQ